jgi:hypothetical protein
MSAIRHLAVMVLLVVPLDDACDVDTVHVVPVLVKPIAREAAAHQLHSECARQVSCSAGR